jgi:hypothetical protein
MVALRVRPFFYASFAEDDNVSGRGGRYPFLDPVREDLLRIKWLWVACCFSPVIYFLIARAIDAWWFREAAAPGLLPVSSSYGRFFSQLFLAAIVALQAALVVLRRWFNRRAVAQAETLRALVAIYMKRTLVLLAVSECAVLGGFLYFVAFGDMRAVLVGGIFSYLFYAQSYPSEEGLARLATRLR